MYRYLRRSIEDSKLGLCMEFAGVAVVNCLFLRYLYTVIICIYYMHCKLKMLLSERFITGNTYLWVYNTVSQVEFPRDQTVPLNSVARFTCRTAHSVVWQLAMATFFLIAHLLLMTLPCKASELRVGMYQCYWWMHLWVRTEQVSFVELDQILVTWLRVEQQFWQCLVSERSRIELMSTIVYTFFIV